MVSAWPFFLLLSFALITRDRIAPWMSRKRDEVCSPAVGYRSLGVKSPRERASLQSSGEKVKTVRLGRGKKKLACRCAITALFPFLLRCPFVFPRLFKKLPSRHDQRRGPGRRPLHPAQVVSRVLSRKREERRDSPTGEQESSDRRPSCDQLRRRLRVWNRSS